MGKVFSIKGIGITEYPHAKTIATTTEKLIKDTNNPYFVHKMCLCLEHNGS